MDSAFHVLGPLRVVIDGDDVTPRPPKERALLALLVLEHGKVVSADRLTHELWPGLPTDQARHVLQVRVAALRKLLRPTDSGVVLDYAAPGYRLSAAPEAIDVVHFVDLVEQARRDALAGDPADAVLTLDRALGLWRGEPLEDVRLCPALDVEAERLSEARLAAMEDRIDALLACGHHHVVVAELDGLVTAHPLREGLWAQRVLALYRCGRQAEALRACASIRRRLVEELGVEPGPSLRALEAAVLDQRAELDWTPAPAAAAPAPVRTGRRPTVATPPVHYVKAPDGVSLAYQVAGDGPLDLIVVPGFVSHLDTWWEAWTGRLVRRLAGFSRLILFDKRGTGLSDRPADVTADQWVDDVSVILDAVGSERADVFGVSAGGPVATMFAATRPQRTRSLVLYGTYARYLWAEDYPIGLTTTPEKLDAGLRQLEAAWGSGVLLDEFCPSACHDPDVHESFARFQRLAASPSAASAYARLASMFDVRAALPHVSAPTLVLHPARDRSVPVAMARHLAAHIAGASLVELDSEDHLIWFSDVIDEITDAVQDFVVAAVPPAEVGQVVATAVAARATAGGDARQAGADRAELGRCAAPLIERYRGRPTCCATDHVVATFDAPGRAVRFASALRDALGATDVAVGVGVHSGECEVRGDDLAGLAVELATRVATLAAPGEVLVSQTVRDLVLGSSLVFTSRGVHDLGGRLDEWHVYALTET